MREGADVSQIVVQEVSSICLRTIRMDELLISSGLLDSVGIIELAESLEKNFQISIPFEELTVENFDSVPLIEHYLNSKRK